MSKDGTPLILKEYILQLAKRRDACVNLWNIEIQNFQFSFLSEIPHIILALLENRGIDFYHEMAQNNTHLLRKKATVCLKLISALRIEIVVYFSFKGFGSVLPIQSKNSSYNFPNFICALKFYLIFVVACSFASWLSNWQ